MVILDALRAGYSVASSGAFENSIVYNLHLKAAGDGRDLDSTTVSDSMAI